MEERKPPSEQLLDVAFLVLDHALATVRRGRVLVPAGASEKVGRGWE